MGRHDRGRRKGGILWGLFFIALGVMMLLNQLGLVTGDWVRHTWPFWPGVFGVAHLFAVRRAKDVSDGVFLILLSGYLFVSNEGLYGLHWGSSWPLVLVAIGVAELVKVVASRFLPEQVVEIVEEVDEEGESHA